MNRLSRSVQIGLILLSAIGTACGQESVTPTASVDIAVAVVPSGQKATITPGGKLELMVSVPTLQRVVFAPADVQAASLRITLNNPPSEGMIAIYGATHAASEGTPQFPAKPLVTIPLGKFVADPSVPKGMKVAELSGLGDMIRDALTSSPAGLPLLLTAQTASPNASVNLVMNLTLLSVKVVSHPKTALFTPPVKPRPNVYATSRNGHLYYGEDRLRIWGCVRPQISNIENADRMANTGFNAIRMWGPRANDLPDGSSPLWDDKTGEFKPAVHGDGSALDEYDRFFARAKTDGMFIMATGLTDQAHVSAHSEWLKGDGKDWAEWQKAISAKPDGWIVEFMAAVDGRLYKARQQQFKDYLTHVNPYTGKDYAHDESIAIYELANENAHVKRTLEKGFDQWPPFFVGEMQKSWNQWLVNRYHDDAGLTKAWTKLDPGESLSGATIKLEPVVVHQHNYADQRGSDFIRFLIELNSDLNKRLEEYARSFAPKGVGVAVIPFSYDTQYMPSAAWLFDDTQNADVANFGMYFWSLQNPLIKPPGMYVMDSHTVEGKITAIYETMDGRPDPYRSAYPYRLAALASWEDWDAIFFHYWEGFARIGHTFSDEDYMASLLSYIAPTHYWTSVYYEKDPALLSPMAIAGQMFIRGLIHSAPHPFTYVLGGKAIFDEKALGWSNLARATYTEGARIRFEPKSDTGLTILGDHQELLDTPPTGAVAMGDEVLWDWPNGRLIIDTPTSKAYVGIPHGNYRFKDGIVVGGFTGKFVSFGMFSIDGKPLTGKNASTTIYISAANDAKNTGYHINFNDATDTTPPGGPIAIGKLIDNGGTTPVIVDHVPYQIWFPTDVGGHFDGYDMARRQRVDRAITDGHIEHDGQELYMATFSVDHPGMHAVTTPQSDVIIAATVASNADAKTTGNPNAARTKTVADVWNPLPGVKWSDNIGSIEGKLRSSGTHLDSTSIVSDHLRIANTNALFQSAADLEIIYYEGQMASINASFTQPPVLATIVDSYTKQFGAPVEKTIAASEDKVSTVKWIHKVDNVMLTITITETQGTLGIVYAVGF